MFLQHNIFRTHCSYFRYYSNIANVLNKPAIGEQIEVKGWVKALRIQKDFVFADVGDGSCLKRLQVLIPKLLRPDELTYGSSVHIVGELSKSPRGQLELVAEKVNVLGKCIVSDGYPFNPRTKHPLEYVRQFLHLRSRTNYMSSMFRIRSSVTKHINDFFASRNILQVHTPILTSNDCEGGGEVFKVIPDNIETIKAMMQKGQNIDTVYFGTKTFLTVSGQLHLEALCRGMGSVYTFGPIFRADNSKGRLHLSEFYMLEAEIAFCDKLEELQLLTEELLKYVFKKTLESNESDLHFIDKEKAKPPQWLEKKFVTLTYDEATDILSRKGLNMSEDRLNKQQELALVDYCEGVPVYIIKWLTKHPKPFYVKECKEDASKLDALDLLTPITGELLGGSLREDDYDKLKANILPENLNWYLELRKFGNIPTGGFGLGLERLLQFMCGVNMIRDTVPFPRWPHHCDM